MSAYVFEEMIGAVIVSIEKSIDELKFHAKDGRIFKFFHYQSCCENVEIEDIAGDLDDLLNTPLVMAESVSNMEEPKLEFTPESYTWTFYRFGTNKGSVTVRWLGTSNGYYSESVSFQAIEPEKPIPISVNALRDKVLDIAQSLHEVETEYLIQLGYEKAGDNLWYTPESKDKDSKNKYTHSYAMRAELYGLGRGC